MAYALRRLPSASGRDGPLYAAPWSGNARAEKTLAPAFMSLCPFPDHLSKQSQEPTSGPSIDERKRTAAKAYVPERGPRELALIA